MTLRCTLQMWYDCQSAWWTEFNGMLSYWYKTFIMFTKRRGNRGGGEWLRYSGAYYTSFLIRHVSSSIHVISLVIRSRVQEYYCHCSSRLSHVMTCHDSAATSSDQNNTERYDNPVDYWWNTKYRSVNTTTKSCIKNASISDITIKEQAKTTRTLNTCIYRWPTSCKARRLIAGVSVSQSCVGVQALKPKHLHDSITCGTS